MPNKYIRFFENAFDITLCDEIVEWFSSLQSAQIVQTRYGEGENTQCLRYNISRSDFHILKNDLGRKILNALQNFVTNKLIPFLLDANVEFPANSYFTNFEVRKFYGNTRVHQDGIEPCHLQRSTNDECLLARFGVIVISLTSSNDTLVFPNQNEEYIMEKGTIIFFPPFWMYPHYSKSFEQCIDRMSLQVWILEESRFKRESINDLFTTIGQNDSI